MTETIYPACIQNLPEADLPMKDLRGWLLSGSDGQVVFLHADEQTVVPEHHHGDQWGIVVDGEMELTIGGKTGLYRRGDSYSIPAGVSHRAILYKGFRALDFFADRDRYKPRA
jgi:mannose-6-phosphate isomerase-like protein (cupin superfamily)